jgi:hypothetical protein
MANLHPKMQWAVQMMMQGVICVSGHVQETLMSQLMSLDAFQ